MIVQFISFIFVVAHWLGCIFYFVTKLQDRDDDWTTYYLAGTLAGPLQNRSVFEKYTAVFYWSLTTMSTIGYGDIVPTTAAERVFVTIAMMLGACFFAYGLTNVCSLIFNHNKYKGRFEAATDELTEYIERRGFPVSLSQALIRSVWFSHNSSTVEDDRSTHHNILCTFSPELQRQAYRHLAKSIFCANNRMPPAVIPNERVVVQLFLMARPVIYPPGEVVWCTYPKMNEWDEFDAVYFLIQGAVQALDKKSALKMTPGEDGEQEIVEVPSGAMLGAGGTFGEKQVFLYGDYPVRETTFTATEHTDIYIINRRALRRILIQEANYVEALMEFFDLQDHDWVLPSELNPARIWIASKVEKCVNDVDYAREAQQFCDEDDVAVAQKKISARTKTGKSRRTSISAGITGTSLPKSEKLRSPTSLRAPETTRETKVSSSVTRPEESTEPRISAAQKWFGRQKGAKLQIDTGNPLDVGDVVDELCDVESVESIQAQIIEAQQRLVNLFHRLEASKVDKELGSGQGTSQVDVFRTSRL